jgi:hypothetical protein
MESIQIHYSEGAWNFIIGYNPSYCVIERYNDKTSELWVGNPQYLSERILKKLLLDNLKEFNYAKQQFQSK